jgi:hypothetical protein
MAHGQLFIHIWIARGVVKTHAVWPRATRLPPVVDVRADSMAHGQVPFCETSARNGAGVESAFMGLASAAMKDWAPGAPQLSRLRCVWTYLVLKFLNHSGFSVKIYVREPDKSKRIVG